jgi:hypothetical protein
MILLKFMMFDFKESKIFFEECQDSPIFVNIPKGVFEISDSSAGLKDSDNEYVHSRSDRCIVIRFFVDSKLVLKANNSYSIKFRLKAEYLRLEIKQLDYIVEVKFKI